LYSISRTTVYKWLAKYSVHYHKETKMVVQAGCRPMESETYKLQSVLQRQAECRPAELERIIGQKQMEIDWAALRYLNKLLEIGSHELKIDLKKSFSTQLSTGFPPIKENTSGVPPSGK
jgi:transposase